MKTQSPIFLYTSDKEGYGFGHKKFYINPKLQDEEFYRVFDPFMAYQELSMYISGVLGVGERPTVDISDIDMAAKKGFDNKSFRTDPGTRKPRWLKRQLRDR